MAAIASFPQTLTPYHAKYYAYDLTRRCPPDSDDRLASALVDAQVDLNPHQIDAALFSFKSPLSRGVLLADEVGLGKTIEAGLVLSQKWAERKRRILVITPSNLRKQWHQELTDKFFLPCRILETKSYNDAIKAGQFRPFEADGHIVICSYQFARNKAADVHNTAWDIVVMDEAHRLRNVYKPSNVIANTLKQALASAPKLLLTATPLQNSLLELFGLVSIIDDQVFGDLKSFREQFSDLTQEQVFATLKRRLAPLCHRTLRRQVTAYVSYTRRLPLVEQFTPDESEDRLYDLVSEYLRRDNLKALPSSQRTLMTLVMRKLLASSSFAIAGALDTLVSRLKATLARQMPQESLVDELDEEYEALDETAEEWEEEEDGPPLSVEDREALTHEIADLEQFRDLATSITQNAKGEALLKALHVAFDKATELGGARKAIIFTESRKTQLYLQRLLADSPWKDGLVLFNGSNTDERSRAIYADWRTKHDGTDQVTGSKTADMRSAIVEYFRDQGQIMIATEAGAEGINLQFCSLVVNYDLPWNPQRIEQRIGRCHRYGQKHDVVVVNFLNRTNAADQRVFQLLSEKFKLFEGVFGASDEVLGAIESGVDFEKRIASIYQQCRKTDEIQTAFDALQQQLDFEITDTLNKARQQLLEHFDDEVREKLRVRNESSRASLNRYEQRLMALTRFELGDSATFLSDGSIWMTIDDNEAHYLKVLCDEVFGRQNFVATCVWEKDKGGRGDADISLSHDNVLVFARDRPAWSRARNLLPRTDVQLNRFKNPDNDPRGPWRQGDDGTAKSGTERQRFEVELPSGRKVKPPPGRYWAFSPETLERARQEGRAYFGSDGDRLPIIKRYLSEVREGVAPRTWWSADEVGTNQQAKRDHLNKLLPDVEPFATPKPEGLLERIIHVATNPGETVLDSFAGSGTTGAVAHKMGRRWVMIELGEHCHTHIIPRLHKVIDGQDPGGATDTTNWKGGGGFRYYRLAPSLLERDKWGNWVINKSYNAAMLAEAVCKLEGLPSRQVWGRRG